MNNYQIDHVLSNLLDTTPVIFLGVKAANELPSSLTFQMPWCLVVNTDPNTKPGEHWISLYFDGNSDRVVEYLCSFGTRPEELPQRIRTFLAHASHLMYNPWRLQRLCTTVCGQFCIYHLICRIRFNFTLDEFLSQFSRYDFTLNDQLVSTLINPLFTFSSEDLRWIKKKTRQCLQQI